MRRDNIQLLSAARKGDVNARWEVGRRYLLGLDGFQRHVPTGIDYLTHASVRHLDKAAIVIAESLSLEDLLEFRQEDALHRAAAAGSVAARVKLATRLCTTSGKVATGIRWFEMAAAAGHAGARTAVAALAQPACPRGLLTMLQAISASGEADGLTVALFSAREALLERDLAQLISCLQVSMTLSASLTPALAELHVSAVQLAEQLGRRIVGIDPQRTEACLEMRANRGDWYAAYALGRALCGVACGPLPPASLVAGPNMRKGVAALLRAADGGCNEAWLHLYRLHAAHETSVSNPHAALLYLEKAATAGEPEAQRKLGALRMRSATCIEESEAAMSLLYQAAARDDPHARGLLDSLVLPLKGCDEDAKSAIEEIRRHDSCLAMRLELSRAFGLTRLEALTVDPARGIRPWGLVVGQNPFIVQSRLGAPRAVPARTASAMDTLRRAASFFDQGGQAANAEGDLRRRSRIQRRAFERHRLGEAMFFSSATSTTLEKLRQGTKWAFGARECLRNALAD